MATKRWFAVIAVVLAVGLGYLAVQTYRTAQPAQCYACRRPIHRHTRTLATINGKSRVFCCPACALSERQQEEKPVRVTQLTAFSSGAKLSPDHAFLVKGSDVNMCAHQHELIVADKQAADLQYDRCSPSMLAFGSRAEAEQFTRKHGGTVLSFREASGSF